MKNLHIAVDNKVATYLQRDGEIVCGNSDYQIVFTFDADWDAYDTKTARFIWNGKHMDVPFTGNECQVPIIKNTDEVKVGVYAGDIFTTTPATIPCKRSILCGDEPAAEMNESTGGGGTITVDQSYNPESENAQSGKAVAEAVNCIGLAAMYTMEPKAPMSSIVEGYTNAFGFEYFNRTPIVGDKFYCYGISDDGVSFHMTARVTGIVDREDGGKNASFVALEVRACGGTVTVDQTYNPASENPQSGIAVAEAIASVSITTPTSSGIPDYVVTEAKEVADKVISKRTINSLVLLMAADIHMVDNTTTNAAILHMAQGMEQIREYVTLDAVVLLGDYVYDTTPLSKAQGIEDIKRVRKYLTKAISDSPVIYMNGNHDTYNTSGDNRIGDNEVYALIGSHNKDTIVDTDNVGGNYGYIDFEKQKIRVIYLNTTDINGGIESSNYISNAQGAWLINTALNLSEKTDEENWGVIVCSHFPIFTSAFADLLTVLTAYKEKTSGTNYGASYDFSASKAELIATFHGHIHNFKVTTVNGIKCICIPNAYPSRQNPYATNPDFAEVDENGTAVYYHKTAGTAEDTSFNAVVIDRENKKIHAICYGAGVDRTISYGDEEVPIYTITNHLTNCSNSNTALSVGSGSAYSATITANSGYTLETVSVTMGGSAVSVTNGVISITSVTGDIIITATATEETGGEEPETPTYTNQVPISTDASDAIYGGDYNGDGVNDGYKTGTRLGSDGTDRSMANHYATGFISVAVGDKLYFENCQIDTTVSTTSTYNEMCCYNADKELLTPIVYLWSEANRSAHEFTVDENNYLVMIDTKTFPIGTAFVRISGAYIGADSIITVNEPIE